MAIRKQQANREKRWKETGRNQVKKNSKFDMARSLFGGGGAPASADYDEEPSSGGEYIEEEISEGSGDYVEEEIVED